jgi:hypothetical protein
VHGSFCLRVAQKRGVKPRERERILASGQRMPLAECQAGRCISGFARWRTARRPLKDHRRVSIVQIDSAVMCEDVHLIRERIRYIDGHNFIALLACPLVQVVSDFTDLEPSSCPYKQ